MIIMETWTQYRTVTTEVLIKVIPHLLNWILTFQECLGIEELYKIEKYRETNVMPILNILEKNLATIFLQLAMPTKMMEKNYKIFLIKMLMILQLSLRQITRNKDSVMVLCSGSRELISMLLV